MPILPEAVGVVDEYVETRRPDPARGFEDFLFLTVQGRRMTENRMSIIVRE